MIFCYCPALRRACFELARYLKAAVPAADLDILLVETLALVALCPRGVLS